MISAPRRVAPRLAATAVATGLLATGAIAAGGAAIADEQPGSGATATLDNLAIADTVDVTLPNGREQSIQGGLFRLTADDGGILQTYCIDFNTPAQNGTAYRETGWDSSTLHNNPEAGRIHWILQNSYPVVNDLSALAASADAGELSDEQAAAGTQAAIWHLSDGVDAVPENENAAKLTEWLLESAEDVPEPNASLELTPSQVSGQPGQIIGPVTVNTTAESVFVTPDVAAAEQGVTIVDANGEIITEDQAVSNGGELYFSVPADAEPGTAALTATASSQVPVGRAFTGVDTRTQTMILAGSSASSVTAGASVNWAGEGNPSVAVTAEQSCADGGVSVTVDNTGDVPFEFELVGETVEVAPGSSESVLVPVDEDQAYEIEIAHPQEGEEPWVFTGVLDCSPADEPGNEPAPATTGGGEADDSPDLAETGSDSGNPAMIAGIAVLLLVVGAAAVFFIRRRSATAGGDE
ncbi:thioester domain-containing protein [Streptomyces radicis]|uniref:TQXA domain-containing protein n=1 Tax=Streptomyces radicis TaxID=1750517 RepID=A0A3A9VXE9_9ACTN|nr:thioester domain-containing protein [Streptomyces radicis]RKN04843.1 TQXA domain-containing protein [Streptomyces radicis]RKN25353.1 TQXA domain-containing protein [Streptomyces radicis]